MGGSINTYVQDVTHTAFFQVAQEEVGTSSNAYITNTYDPNTGRPFNATTTSMSRPTAVPSSSTTAQPSRAAAEFILSPYQSFGAVDASGTGQNAAQSGYACPSRR